MSERLRSNDASVDSLSQSPYMLTPAKARKKRKPTGLEISKQFIMLSLMVILNILGIMVSAADIKIFEITAINSNEVQLQTMFRLKLQPTNALPTASKIEIQFPSLIVLSEGTCVLGQTIGDVTSDSGCQVASNVLTLTNPFGSSGSFAQGGSAFEFQFSTGGTNPQVAGDAGTFTVKTYNLDSGSASLVDQSSFTTVYSTLPGQLTAQFVSSSSYEALYQPSTYTISFTPRKNILLDSVIQLAFPSQVSQIASSPSCTLTRDDGITTTISIIVRSSNPPVQYVISGAFSTAAQTSSNSKLTIVCDGFKNPFTTEVISSFTVTIEDSNGKAIETINTGITMQMLTIPNTSSICGVGWYTETGKNTCYICPAGYMCPNGVLTECSGTGFEQFSYEGQTSCSICPAGYECPNKYSIPVLCPKGFYSNLGDGKCSICPAGSACKTQVLPPLLCDSGYYSLQGSTYCRVCPLGYKCPFKTQEPLACPQGTYAPQKSTECLECPIGSFCPSTKTPQPYPCPSGYFSSKVNQVACTPCPAGFKCSDPQLNPIFCDEGYFSFGFAAECTKCPSGYYCPYKNKEPIVCPKNKYSMEGQAECFDCPDGYSCLISNQELQIKCESGQYRVRDGRTPVCRDCPVGHSCADVSFDPQQCPPGTYALSNSTSCTECPVGNYCPTIGAQPMICPLGTYQNETGKTFCHSCPPGFYCPNLSILQPVQCPVGYFAPVGNLTACFPCPEGFNCPTSELLLAPVLCPNGTYSQQAQGTCTRCEGGFSCPDTRFSQRTQCDASLGLYSFEGYTHCFSCPIGKKCTTLASDTGILKAGEPLVEDCLIGEISDEGQSVCIQCPAGYACNTRDSAGKSACSAGLYSLEGESTCKACPAGFQCPDTTGLAITECLDGQFSAAGQIQCLSCPKGFFCPFKNQAVMERCPPGTYSLGNQRSCIECPEHYECPHRDSLVKLKNGYFSPAGTGVPIKCRAGWECRHEGVASSYVRPCEMGYTTVTGEFACTICPIGYYCPLQDHKPIECPEGYYNDQPGQVKCTRLCPRGQFRVKNNTLQCEDMIDGEQYTHPFVRPVKCPTGTYSNPSIVNDPSFMGCQKCEPGVICLNGETSKQSRGNFVCSPGYWCNQVDERSSIFGMWACPPGFYATNATAAKTRDEACARCDSGYFCEGNQRPKTSCEPGYYCHHKTSRATEYPCPAGTYQPLYGATDSTSCKECEIGFYCPEGSASPLPCLPGNICPSTGLKDYQQVPCPGGSYQSMKQQTTCNVCPKGQYCPYGSVLPMLCPPGTYNDQQGKEFQTDCKLCPKNYLCAVFGLVDYQNQGQPALEYGHLSPLGSKYAQELTCPPGTYNQVVGSSATDFLDKPENCLPCQPGQSCPAGTSSNGTPIMAVRCEPGHYCPTGTMHDKQYPCPGGTYSNSVSIVSSSQCNQCPSGYFCPPGSYRPFICPNGYYCPLGTENFQHYPCPLGTYIQTRGLQQLSQCLQCPKGSFCQDNQVVLPKKCPVGSYADLSAAQQPDNSINVVDPVCKQCLPGHKCPTEGMIYPMGCPPGTYSPEGSDQCFPCLEGFDCSQLSTSVTPSVIIEDTDNGNGFSRTISGVGTYSQTSYFNQQMNKGVVIDNLSDKFTLISGNVTFYSMDADGAKESFSIPGQKQLFFTKNTLSELKLDYSTDPVPLSMLLYKNTANSFCPVGYFCVGSMKKPCSPGHFCPRGTMREIPCPVGTYNNAPGKGDLTECINSPAGFFISKVGQTAYQKNLCYLGHTCEPGSNHQFMYRCPRGQYQNEFGQTSCKTCPQGFYCTEVSNNPIVCPQGYYCPAGTGFPLKCPKGTFGSKLGLKSQTECEKCTAGAFCSQQGISSPDGLCDPGFYCGSGASVPNPTDGSTGNVCDEGGFCEYGSKKIASCPPGTFNPNKKGKNRQDCIACTPGKYCSGSSMGTPTGDCLAGYYCPLKSTVNNQVPADPGHYTLTGAATQTPCPVGTYNPFTARSACIPCRAGFYCDEEGMSDEIWDCPQGHYCIEGSKEVAKCPIGTYNNQWNAKSLSECKPCLPGKYCDQQGLVEPEGDCQQGFYCKSGAITPDPASDDASLNFGPCPAGHYCPVATWKPIPCPAGTFSTSIGLFTAEDCTPCTGGKYCPTAGMSAEPTLNCDEGFYCPSGSITARPAQHYCKPGQFCKAGSDSPTNCPAGKYQPMFYQSDCLICPQGFYCTEASVSYSDKKCPAGYQCPSETQYATQYPCAAGKYQPYQGQTTCVDCDPGKFCATSALVMPTGNCFGGYFCKGASTTDKPTVASIGGQCQRGQFCPPGSPFPRDCTPGRFCGAIGLSAVSGICSAGYYCQTKATKQTPTDINLEGGSICSPGFYCPAGSSAQIPCPAGYFSGTQGNKVLTDCKICPTGRYCESSGLAQPTGFCSAGYYCPEGSKSPKAIICPAGSSCSSGSSEPKSCHLTKQYQDLVGQSICKTCPAGYECFNSAILLCTENFYCPLNVMERIKCPAGTFTRLYNASSSSDCVSCLPGRYCIQDDDKGIIMQKCPGGVVCSSGASSAAGNQICPRGFYCPPGTSKPIPCTPGMYCQNEGRTEPEGNCAAGYYCKAGSRTQRPLDGIQGNVCPRGFYCPEKTASPIGCPIGTYNPDDSKTNLDACLQCPPGYLCNKRGLSTYEGRCKAGYFCPDPSNPDIQQPCPEGFFCREGSQTATKCASGFYQPQKYQSTCLECPTGFYCSQTNTAISIVCPAGKYCPQRSETPKDCPAGTYSSILGLKDLSECTQCREGFFCAVSGLAEPTGKCQAGYFCKQGANSPTPIASDFAGPCRAGFHCPEGSPVEMKCPVGTYSDKTMLKSVQDCSQCPATFFCSTKGKLGDFNSNKCANGYLCNAGSKSSTPSLLETGVLCPSGSYCINGIAILCPKGTYQPKEGASDCLVCPAGKYCDSLGLSTVLQLCPPGSYCPQTDKSNLAVLKIPCPAGTYSPFEGNQKAEDCLPCKEGHYCNEGSISPTGQCVSPYYCNLRSTMQQPEGISVYVMGSNMVGGLCPAGYKCPTGTIAPEPCPVGTYQPFAGQNDCITCPKGKYCDEMAIDSEVLKLKDCKAGYVCFGSSKIPSPNDGIVGQKCQPGFYCPKGTTQMIPCPGGTYEPRDGSSECQLCPSGFYCPANSHLPLECPKGYFCASESTSPEECPPGKFGHTIRLKSSDECATCPAGKFCQNGQIKGNCAAGVYCDSGAFSPTQDSKLCPIGHYCNNGTLYPTICPTGTTTFQRGAKNATDCQDCKEGFYCLEGSISQFVCPKGYYCAKKVYPKACPEKTYNPERIKSSILDCISCPPGYFCNSTGIANYQSFACPQGHFCPIADIISPLKCPGGTYNPRVAAVNLTDCIDCPEGHFCPEASVYPQPCKNGTYCPIRTVTPKICPSGFFCPTQVASTISCPSSFFCPTVGSDQYLKCKNGTYCPIQSTSETLCPSGSFGSSDPRNQNSDDACTACEAGLYSNVGMNECKKCTLGYVCLGNTTSERPLDVVRENGYICPRGFYCPEGSVSPRACPKGTFGSRQGLSNLAQCSQCPSGSYGDEIGLIDCKQCGGSSRAQTGAESCFCSGLNRIYLKDTKACVCKPGFISSDSQDSNQDSTVDCQEKIYQRCTEGQEQDLYGNCKDKNSCAKECDGGPGRIQSGLGICQCDNAQNVDDICNEACRAQSKKVSFTADGKVQIYDPLTKITQTASQQEPSFFKLFRMDGTMGQLKCAQADQSQCQLLSVGKDQNTGDFIAQYSLTSTITGKNRRLLESERRYLQVTNGAGQNSIKNPVICMPQGSALLFDNLSSKNYPVYQKDSLINTNPTFDFSRFLLLGDTLRAQNATSRNNITRFIFTFDNAGVYVFADSNNTAKLTVVSVMHPSQQCPQNTLYASLTQSNLLKVGIALQKNIVYSPDWGFFIGAVGAFLALIIMSIFVIGYVYRKSWKTSQVSQGKMMTYQKRHYDQIKNEDPEDPDALISINADSQSFYVLNQGKDILRTREQLKEKRAKDQEEREKKKRDREDKKRVLELEQVEDLKERLNKHMQEIRKLFNMNNPNAPQEDDDNEAFMEEDPALANQRLLDQILKLKLIIKENRRVLEGEEEDLNDSGNQLQREELEKQERERRDNERKIKEEQERNARDEAYAKAQESQAKKAQDLLEEKKDKVLDDLDKDADKRKKDMLMKMQRNNGMQMSREDQEKFMSDLDDNLNKIGDILQRDEQDQDDLLRRKLQDRANRRKKLQDKLKEHEKVIDSKLTELNEKKVEVEQNATEQLAKLDDQLAKEKKEQEAALEENLEHMKMEKLASFEDKLREAKDSKDFGKVLDGYQQASKRVDNEMEKERTKQQTDLEKALKNRRGQRRAQIEKDKNEQLKQLQKQFDEDTEKQRRQVDEIKGIIKNEEGNANQGGENQTIQANIEKLKQITSQGSQADADIDKTLKQSKMELMKKLSDGMLNSIERKMHQHVLETKDFDDKLRKETKSLDEQVSVSKQEAKTKLSQALMNKEHLIRQIREVGDDDELKARLMGQLDQCEDQIVQLMASETADQESLLQKKLAARRKKKAELGEQQREMKQRQMQELQLETLIKKDAVDIENKRTRDRQALEQIIEEMKLSVPREELPYAIQRALDTKHETELNDLLAKLFEQKCKELQEEIFHLLEEKLNMQNLILKDSKDSLELVIDIESKATSDSEGDRKLRAQAQQLREAAKLREERAMADLDMQFRMKEQQIDSQVSERMMEMEMQRLQWLKGEQLKEKMEILDKYLPSDSIIRELIQEMADEEAKELEEFKREQARKIEDMEKQRQALLLEMQTQRSRLDKAASENKRLEQEERKREQAQQQRKKRQDAARQASDQIEKIKKELEKVNEQLDSALAQERARQLQMMQEMLEKKVAEADRFEKEEEERLKKEADEERRVKEEQEKRLIEERERVEEVRKQVNEKLQLVDKKKYMGPGKIEQRTEYYTLLMRKRETKISQKLTSQKFSAMNSLAMINDQGNLAGLMEIDGVQTSSASKEQQFKLLTDILSKIEMLEKNVKQQVNKQRQVLGIGSQLGNYANLETSSAHKSTNSFMTGSRYGGASAFMR